MAAKEALPRGIEVVFVGEIPMFKCIVFRTSLHSFEFHIIETHEFDARSASEDVGFSRETREGTTTVQSPII